MTRMNTYYRSSTEPFRYTNNQDQQIDDIEIIAYIEGLAIPPAWRDVEVSARPGAKVLATGYDSADRKQYIYNPKFRERQERVKFDRIIAFANALPMMREITGKHLRHHKLDRQKVLACMVRLIDHAYFRVGNERYAKENKTYGLTTLRTRHLRIEGDHLIFHYIGKSHKEQVREIEDHGLAVIVRKLDELPGYEIFKYYNDAGELVPVRSDDLNAYIKEIMGYDFSAKDFRTWAGTLIAAVALSDAQTDVSSAKAKRYISEAVRRVAEKLGNTPAIARSSYIDPRVIEHYMSGQTIKSYIGRINYYLDDDQLLGAEEVAVLKLLKHKLSSAKP